MPRILHRVFTISGLLPALLGAVITFGVPIAAHAGLSFCNQTANPIQAAVGYRGETGEGGEGWVSEGWWQIDPGQCARVYGKSLGQRFYFYYARSLTPAAKGKTPNIWSGKYEFCTDTKAFRVEGDGNCEARSYQTRGFQQIDLAGHPRDYTLDFKDKN